MGRRHIDRIVQRELVILVRPQHLAAWPHNHGTFHRRTDGALDCTVAPGKRHGPRDGRLDCKLGSCEGLPALTFVESYSLTRQKNSAEVVGIHSYLVTEKMARSKWHVLVVVVEVLQDLVDHSRWILEVHKESYCCCSGHPGSLPPRTAAPPDTRVYLGHSTGIARLEMVDHNSEGFESVEEPFLLAQYDYDAFADVYRGVEIHTERCGGLMHDEGGALGYHTRLPVKVTAY